MSRIEYKSLKQMRYMREAALVVADIHRALAEAAEPGVTLLELDAISRDTIGAHGAHSNFLGYHGYPASVCISVGDTVVHGIPDDYRLREGDLVSFDCGAYVVREGKQWHGDACFSLIVGGEEAGSEEARQLNALTREAMWSGVAALAHARTITGVGDAVEDAVELGYARYGWEAGIVEEFLGHGIGTQMHQEPEVLNYRARGRGAKIRAGLVVCVEPILTRGAADVVTMPDQWTVKTADGSLACHWEHEVAITPSGIAVLSAPDWGRAGLAPFGVSPVELGDA